MDKKDLINYYKKIMALEVPISLRVGLINLYCVWIITSDKEYGEIILKFKDYMDRYLKNNGLWTKYFEEHKDDLDKNFTDIFGDGKWHRN